jgi:sporulation protein YlmC with PRC-barrel domain
MLKVAPAVLAIALAAAIPASAQNQQLPSANPTGSAQILTTLPQDAMTVTHWYKQNVYDPNDNKIGEIEDVLVDKGGKIDALIIGVGGFLGIGEKDVAVAFNAVEFKTKNNSKWYPVMNTTKDALKNAPGYRYDRTNMVWVPDNDSRGGTVGGAGNTNQRTNPTPNPTPNNAR